MSGLSSTDVDAVVTKTIASLPDWLRRDLLSLDLYTRAEAEAAVAAMISMAIAKHTASD